MDSDFRRFMAGSWNAALLAVGVNTLLVIGAVALGTLVMKDYGWALFVVLPFVMGVTTVMVQGIGGRRGFMEFWVSSLVSLGISMCGMMVLGLEGAGCMLMAAPLWIGCVTTGVALAYPVHRLLVRPSETNGWARGGRGFPMMVLMFVVVPLSMGMEHVAGNRPALLRVDTVVEIDAPAEVVWERVLAFPALPKPEGWAFALGAAYPKHAVIHGHGVGAERHCVFSTGAFVEPITAWEEGKLLAFDVTECPPSMTEVGLYGEMKPPHVEGYFVSRRGQFLLEDLGNGRTRLTGTTWYENNMYPGVYWRMWSDAVVHQIHGNVLRHVKAVAEGDVAVKRDGG